MLSESHIDETKAASKERLARKNLLSKGITPLCIQQVAGYTPVIVSFDGQLLELTHPSAQLESSPRIFCAHRSFTDGLIRAAQLVVSIGKTGSNWKGFLKK